MSLTRTDQSPQLKKSVSFVGMVALGLGGVWGTSWLLVSSAWMDAGGGMVNALLAWVLIAIIEIPFVLSYVKAIPLFPKAEGEMSYASAAFGRSAGFWAGWFGIVVNLIVCAYEVVALVRMASFLWPSINNTTWYELQGSTVGPVAIVLGIALVVGIAAVHLGGIKVSSRVIRFITAALMVLVTIGVVLALIYGDFANYKPYFGKPVLAGVIAVAVMLPFSFAGWESIAKGAEEARDSSSSGRAVPVAWGAGWLAYVLSLAATGLVMPWQEGAQDPIPFATGLSEVTGFQAAGTILVFTALLGVVGVYNVLFYSVTRQLFGMARAGMLPRWFNEVDARQVPRKAILFVTAILLITPFLGRGFLIPYVDAASFAYVVLWGMTFVAISVLQRRFRGTSREFSRAGGRAIEALGVFSILFMLIVMLYPGSPGSLIWPVEHIILGALILIGGALMISGRRHRVGSSSEGLEQS